jgi:ribosomal protein S18 acetylase RimI-like enzyme
MREVRPAETDDTPAIERIAREAWHAAYDDILGPDAVDAKLDEWYDHEELRESVTADEGVFVLAGADPVGFAQAVPGEDAWHLARIYVDPEQWGEGVGTALLDRVEDELRAAGAECYRLAVLAENTVGVGFYESRSFERFDTRTVELAGVETAEYWYRKAL